MAIPTEISTAFPAANRVLRHTRAPAPASESTLASGRFNAGAALVRWRRLSVGCLCRVDCSSPDSVDRGRSEK
ncbi:MAG: hypothetical protein AAGF11_49570 [Myxococcota bacterium]